MRSRSAADGSSLINLTGSQQTVSEVSRFGDDDDDASLPLDGPPVASQRVLVTSVAPAVSSSAVSSSSMLNEKSDTSVSVNPTHQSTLSPISAHVMSLPSDVNAVSALPSNGTWGTNDPRFRSTYVQHKLTVRKLQSRWEGRSLEGLQQNPGALTALLSDMALVCNIALELNTALTQLGESLECAHHLRQEMDLERTEMLVRHRELEDRLEQSTVEWRVKYDQAMEELDRKEEELFALRRSDDSGVHGENKYMKISRSDSIDRKMGAMQSELTQLRAEKASLQSQLLDLEGKLRAQQTDEAASRDRSYEVTNMKRRLADLEVEKDTLTQVCVSLQKEIETSESKLQQMQDRYLDLKAYIINSASRSDGSLDSNRSAGDTDRSLSETPESIIRRAKEKWLAEQEAARSCRIRSLLRPSSRPQVEVTVLRSTSLEPQIKEVPVEVLVERKVIKEVPTGSISLEELRAELQKLSTDNGDRQISIHVHQHAHAHNHAHKHTHYHRLPPTVTPAHPEPAEPEAAEPGAAEQSSPVIPTLTLGSSSKHLRMRRSEI